MNKYFSQTCRSCLHPLDMDTKVPIFKRYDSDVFLSEMISTIIHIPVSISANSFNLMNDISTDS